MTITSIPSTLTSTLPNSKQRTGTPGAHVLPPNWHPKRRTVTRWAKRLGVPERQVVQQYLSDFKRAAVERLLMYRNWDTAFANSIRNDWFNVRTIGDAHA